MKLLSRFVAVLLAFAVITTISAYVLGSTIWNSDKLRQAANAGNVSEKIASVLPGVIGANFGLSADENFILKTVITPERVKPYLDQLLSKIAQPDSSPVKIDFKELRSAITGESLPLPPKLAELTAHPVTIINASETEKIASAKHLDDQAKMFGLIASVVLGLLIIMLAKQSRFIVLGEAAIATAVGLALIGLILPGLPGIFTSVIDTSQIALLRDTINGVAKSLLLSAQAIYYRSAIAAAAIALLLFVVHGIIALGRKFSRNKHT